MAEARELASRYVREGFDVSVCIGLTSDFDETLEIRRFRGVFFTFKDVCLV